MNVSKHSELASMYMEATSQLDGYEEQTYLNSFLESIGDEPQCLPITHSSMYQLWAGSSPYTPPSSSTRYQWRELYAAWRLAIPSPNLQAILVFPPKDEPYILRMDWPSLTLRQKENFQSIVSTTYISAKRYSKDSYRATLLRNYALST